MSIKNTKIVFPLMQYIDTARITVAATILERDNDNLAKLNLREKSRLFRRFWIGPCGDSSSYSQGLESRSHFFYCLVYMWSSMSVILISIVKEKNGLQVRTSVEATR